MGIFWHNWEIVTKCNLQRGESCYTSRLQKVNESKIIQKGIRGALISIKAGQGPCWSLALGYFGDAGDFPRANILVKDGLLQGLGFQVQDVLHFMQALGLAEIDLIFGQVLAVH